MLIEAVAIGLVYGLAFFEITGLVAGGLVVPGYLAVSLGRPLTLAACLGAAFLTLILVRLLARLTILFGRRRFVVSVLTGFALQWTLGSMAMGLDPAVGRLDVVGFVIPGLMAHEMDRQGPGRTLLALLIVTGLVHLTMRALGWIRF